MRKLLLFFFFLTAFSLFSTTAFAAGNAITVQPSLLQLDLTKASPEASLSYTNTTSVPVELSFEAQDYKPLEDGYQLSFLSDANNYHYGLSSWIHFSNTALVLDPQETATLTLFIDKPRLTPGGHYATIFAHITPQTQYSKQIQVKGILASLLFVKTNTGQENETATIASFALVRNMFDFPDSTYVRFDNTGDIDETPHGLVQIFDSNHNLIAKGILNETSAPTLPESIRRYYISLHNLVFVFPGVYTAKLWLHYDPSNKQLATTITFFSTGSIPGFMLLLPFLFFLGFLWWRKRHH